MRSRGPRLGELLERRGVLSRDQLLRALRHQKVVGGKLGTCLLEIDAVPEDEVVRALAEQQNVPWVSPEDLRAISAEVRSLLPAKVARAHFVVPVRATSTQVEVAMIDSRDLRALDELAFVTGRRVRPLVATEARILEALEKHYGEECPQRFAKLVERLDRAQFVRRNRDEPARPEQLSWDSGLGVRATPPDASPLAPVPAPPPPPPPHEFVQAVPAAAAPPPAPAAVAPAGPLPLAGIEQRLMNPEDADAVGRALIDAMAGRCGAAALLRQHGKDLAGWFAHGLDAERLASLRVPLDRPSIFLTLREGAALHRGPLAELPAHLELIGLLGPLASHDLLALPLRVRDRLVAVLLVAPAGAAPRAQQLADLQSLVAKASIALELCIMRKKLHRA